MPRVPFDPMGSVAPGGAPTPFQQAAPSVGGEAIGKGLGDVARGTDIAAQHAVLWENRALETDAKQKDLDVARALDTLQYDPENGYLTKQGRNAMDGFKDASDTARQIERDALDALVNPMARKLAAPAIQTRVQSAIAGMSRHAAVENRKYQVETSASRVEASITVAGHDYLNDQGFERALDVASNETEVQNKLLN